MFQVVPENDHHNLLDEFVEFQLLPDDELPTAGSTDDMWMKIGKLSIQATGTALFAQLSGLAKALLTIPNSNAAPERTFSMVKKIFTEQRSQMDNSTLAALLKCKINTDYPCHTYQPTKHTVHLAKVACTSYNELYAAARQGRERDV